MSSRCLWWNLVHLCVGRGGGLVGGVASREIEGRGRPSGNGCSRPQGKEEQ
jgi:hypothetical protein